MSATGWPDRAAGAREMPYAGLTQSGVGYRVLRYGWRSAVDHHRLNLGVEAARQDGVGNALDHLGGGTAGLGRGGEAAHSVQVRGRVTF